MAWISPLDERAIGQVVVEPADVALGKPVAVAQAGPAVGPLHELVAEPELRARDGAADRTDCAMPSRAATVFAHADRIGVVEAERPAHAHPRSASAARSAALVTDLLARQDLAGDRAGVLGIDVELVGLERVEEDLRAAQLATMHGRDARVLDQTAGRSRPGSPIR